MEFYFLLLPSPLIIKDQAYYVDWFRLDVARGKPNTGSPSGGNGWQFYLLTHTLVRPLHFPKNLALDLTGNLKSHSRLRSEV